MARASCPLSTCNRLHVSTHDNKLSSRGCAAATAKPLRVAVMHWGQIAALDWNNEAVLASGSCGSCKVNQFRSYGFALTVPPSHLMATPCGIDCLNHLAANEQH